MPNPDGPVVVDLQQSGDSLRAEFPFAVETPAAVFQRADMLWLVFDSAAKIDLAALKADAGHAIRSTPRWSAVRTAKRSCASGWSGRAW